MPVSLLLCEGSANSPDARVLHKLLGGRCAVIPRGSRWGMAERIVERREALQGRTVFGLLDGDFPLDRRSPTETPREWTASDGQLLGWYWERKEIENYLLDPVIVVRALGATAPPRPAYEDALMQARDAIATYQAARTALSNCRRRTRGGLPTAFGRRRGRHRYMFPDNLDETECRNQIGQVVRSYNDDHLVHEGDVSSRFDALLPDFDPRKPGARCEHYLHTFAGKDLLYALDSALGQLGHGNSTVFCERTLQGIQNSPDDIGDWLPEWKALQALMDGV